MIILTGGAGFIGSHVLRELNRQGRTDILVVDDMTDGRKYRNLLGCQFLDYVDKQDFLQCILQSPQSLHAVDAILHQGACSDTTEWNGYYMLQNNYVYSNHLLHFCLLRKIPFIYASSAAVYGLNAVFDEQTQFQAPLNVYGYSKWLLDQYVLHQDTTGSQVVGLRYFNVYGPHEEHKNKMASVAFHAMQQLEQTKQLKLFGAWDGYGAGEQKRDFVFVSDIAKLNVWLLSNPNVRGIFNVGTGEARSFNELAQILLKLHGYGCVEYIPFPDHLKGAYQSFTQANITRLREAGYQAEFTSLESGVQQYYKYMHGK